MVFRLVVMKKLKRGLIFYTLDHIIRHLSHYLHSMIFVLCVYILVSCWREVFATTDLLCPGNPRVFVLPLLYSGGALLSDLLQWIHINIILPLKQVQTLTDRVDALEKKIQ